MEMFATMGRRVIFWVILVTFRYMYLVDQVTKYQR